MQDLSQRKPNRLKGFDYSSNGGYFLTVCTKNRTPCFGEVLEGKMILNDLGKIVENEIYNTVKIRKNIEIDEFIVMPDHIHLIIFITVENDGIVLTNEIPNKNIVGNDCIVPNKIVQNSVGNDCIVPNIIIPKNIVQKNIIPKNIVQKNGPMQLVPTVMKGLKSTITRQINEFQKDFFFSWQKSYYDRIIRNEDELMKIRQYILNNPLKWELEKNNVENIFM